MDHELVSRLTRESNSPTNAPCPDNKMSSKTTNYSMKKAELYGFHANSRNNSAFSMFMENTKERFTWELHKGNLKCWDGEESVCSSNTVVSVEQRTGTNILIIGCGPGGRLLTFIEFDTKKQADEWEEELCKCIGQEYVPPIGFRRELTEVRSPRGKMKLIKTASAFPDVQLTKPKVTTMAMMTADKRETQSVDLQQAKGGEVAGKNEELKRSESTSSLSSSSSSSAANSILSPSSSTDFSECSSPGSLRSYETCLRSCSSQMILENDPTKIRYTREGLIGTVLVDYNGQVCVKSTTPESRLHVGDRILSIDDNPNLMDARAISEYIRTTKSEKFSLRVFHGVRCAVSTQERDFRIDVKGNEMVQVDIQDVVTKISNLACTTSQGQSSYHSSYLAITNAVNFPDETDVLKEVLGNQVQDILQEAPGFLVLHLQPECVLQALSELEGASIGQGFGSDEVVVDSGHSSPGDQGIDAERGYGFSVAAVEDDATVESESDPSSPGVQGPFAGATVDLESDPLDVGVKESTKVTLRNHGNAPSPRHRQSRRLGRVEFPDLPME